MPAENILIRLLVTIVFGAILGIESETREVANQGKDLKEKTEPQRLGGVRTYSVLALIGGISGIFYTSGAYPIVYMIFGAVILLVLAAYVMNVQIKKAFGLTTELAILITFLIGFLTTSSLIEISIVLVLLILLTFFLSQKRGFSVLIERINHVEITDLIKFGLVSVVVLPLLPNQTFTIQHILDLVNARELITAPDILTISVINPFRVWSIVVVISGINLIGYLIGRLFGNRNSTLLTSIAGGLISSTSTTIAFAASAKTNAKQPGAEYTYAGGTVIANAVSFVTILTFLALLNNQLLGKLIMPFSVMLVIGIIVGVIITLRGNKSNITLQPSTQSNFSLLPAIKFVLLIVAITIAIQLINLIQNQAVTVIATALSGVIGMDPATIAISDLVRTETLSLQLGAVILLIANAVNFGAKFVYSYIYGTPRFARYVGLGLVLTLIGSILIFIV